jgi:hypothetical protein
MERADVKKALDEQLQPVREDSPELKEAFGKIAELANELARQRDVSTRLREQLAARAAPSASAPSPATSAAVSTGSLVNGWLEAAIAAVAAALLIAAAFSQ